MAKRDYSAELARRNAGARSRGYASYYAERIARGEARGLSRSQAAGHPSRRIAEVPASIARVPRTHRNFIANKIKDVAGDIGSANRRGEGGEDLERRKELYGELVNAYQNWRKSGWSEEGRREVIDRIREYDEIENDDIEFTIGDTP